MDLSKIQLFDWALLGKGTIITVGLCAAALLAGSALAFATLVPLVIPPLRLLRFVSSAYVELFRTTPLLLQLIAIFFGLPFFGIVVTPVVAALIALSLYSGAYLSEILRAGIESVQRGQWEAALLLGMKRQHVWFYVILPQAGLVSLPALVSFVVMLVKGSSVVSVLGFAELTRSGRLVVDWTREAFAVWVAVAAIYFALCYPLSVLGHRMEKRLHRGRRAPV